MLHLESLITTIHMATT